MSQDETMHAFIDAETLTCKLVYAMEAFGDEDIAAPLRKLVLTLRNLRRAFDDSHAPDFTEAELGESR